jgi:hypothetical protein
MRPGDSLRFKATTPEAATDALRDLHAKALATEPRPVDVRYLDLQTLSEGEPHVSTQPQPLFQPQLKIQPQLERFFLTSNPTSTSIFERRESNG